MIKAVIFDVGGVLEKKIHQRIIKELADKHNLDYECMLKNSEPIFHDVMINKLTESQYYEYVIKHNNLPVEVEELTKRWKDLTEPIEGSWEIVNELKGKYKLGIISDMGIEWAEFRENKNNLRDIFDVIIWSYDVKTKKPGEKIFKYALEKLKLKAEECIFIDDYEKNIEISKKLGIKSILFENSEQLRKKLKKLISL